MNKKNLYSGQEMKKLKKINRLDQREVKLDKKIKTLQKRRRKIRTELLELQEKLYLSYKNYPKLLNKKVKLVYTVRYYSETRGWYARYITAIGKIISWDSQEPIVKFENKTGEINLIYVYGKDYHGSLGGLIKIRLLEI
ncbi:MAG: hypothetical protein PHE59_01800 [Patescibacteria group bacterium]|nr:hypothetical protein [Patescibacteria group bacterium]MDD5164536.1 hypothetical protein [Patescibacteria group bacterium]MDD5534722.1 hypothetical protein [Patescibacteria group bacterium]